MILAKTTSYALRILIFMAARKDELISAQSLFDSLKIRKQYLRRILTDLSKNGFIKSTRGRNGGYVFARSPKKIFISEIIEAVEGFESFNACLLGEVDCQRAEKCEVHQMWDEVKSKMITSFKTTSLDKLSLKDIKKL
jgi:Rrf2 family protein